MSVVVAIKSNNQIFMGSDSQVTKGWTRTSLTNPNNYKVWKVKGVDHCLMAACGSVTDAGFVRVEKELIPEINVLKDDINFDFVVKELVPKLTEILDDNSQIKAEDGRKFFRSSFLFAYKDKLFSIGCDRSVIEIDDYVAIGSGEEPAIGSLLTSTSLVPKERIKLAIKASATNDIYVDYPIILTDTESTTFEVITEKDLG